jgi:hypothetical protein
LGGHAQSTTIARAVRQERRRGGDFPAVLIDSLSLAFDRLDDFVEVQATQLTPESVGLLQAAAGITERERRVISDRVLALDQTGTPAHKGAVLLGLLVGLFAAQFEHD